MSSLKRLKLVPDIDEEKEIEWFVRLVKKTREVEWPRKRWMGLVANKLMGKGLSAFDRRGLYDLEDYADFKTAILKEYELFFRRPTS